MAQYRRLGAGKKAVEQEVRDKGADKAEKLLRLIKALSAVLEQLPIDQLVRCDVSVSDVHACQNAIIRNLQAEGRSVIVTNVIAEHGDAIIDSVAKANNLSKHAEPTGSLSVSNVNAQTVVIAPGSVTIQQQDPRIDELLMYARNSGLPIPVAREIVVRFGEQAVDYDATQIQAMLAEKADEYRALKRWAGLGGLRNEALLLIDAGDFVSRNGTRNAAFPGHETPAP